MSSESDVTTSTPLVQLTGRVKWFNNKAGYGFITVTDGDRSGTDVFVHHSTIGVSSQQYKYLVQGEYVDFDLTTSQGGAHEFQASNVVGIKGGKLMCETRREFKISRSSYKTTTTGESEQVVTPASVSVEVTSRPNVTQKTSRPRNVAPRARGEGPRDSEQQPGWTTVTTEKKVVKQITGKPRGRPPRQQVEQQQVEQQQV